MTKKKVDLTERGLQDKKRFNQHSRNADTGSIVTEFLSRRRLNSTMEGFARDYRDEHLTRDYRSI